jgi:hemoglobin
MSIYDEIGGRETVRAAVRVFYDRVLADPLLAPYFVSVNRRRLEAHQHAFLSAALGGPELFAGRPLAQAHAPLAVDDAAFDATVEQLAMTLLDLGVGRATVGAVRDRLEGWRGQVVSG